ncbi:interphotoreceptor matrix proteoglycan 1-like [Candoia aspera]|uniref:interphotoreceptor matrix proteoglycan 1-like n=1 Tax=Candoia aspera TaxID=51853 RepID=UPI002FD7C8FD
MDEISIEELSVPITVEAQVKVDNKKYNETLENPSSPYYKEIETQFRHQMKNIYKNIPGYDDVKVIRMSKGSIIVIHEVIFQTIVTNDLSMIKKELESIKDSVKQRLDTINSTQECNDTSGKCWLDKTL